MRKEAIIFDLGGVILPLDHQRSIDALSALFQQDVTRQYVQFLTSSSFECFERGELTAETFYECLTRAFKLPGAPHPPQHELGPAWNALLCPIPERHARLLGELGRRARIFLLSNTNAVHHLEFVSRFDRERAPDLPAFEDLFEKAHYSFQMGARKPEARIFQALIEEHQLDPACTRFIDDNPDNVAAAKAVGLLAELHPENAPLEERFPS